MSPARLISSLAAIVLIAAVAGCGDDSPPPATRADERPAPGAAATPSGEPATVSDRPGRKHPEPAPDDPPPGAGAEIEALASDALGGAAFRAGKIHYFDRDRRATIDVYPGGGPYAGQTVTFTLADDGGGWRIVRVVSDTPVGP